MSDRTICGICGSQYDKQGRCECHAAGQVMDRDTVIRLAREAGMIATERYGPIENYERFAALVAAHEREACAKVCELVAREIDDTNGTATYIANAIRSRT